MRICCIAALYLILYDTNPMVPDHLAEVARNITFIKGDVLDFTYIEDAARGTAMLYQAKALKHNVYNIATGVPTSVGRVAELCREYSSFSVDVDLGPGELMQRCEALDISRARKELGFEPRYSVEEGIQKYADWMKKVMK